MGLLELILVASVLYSVAVIAYRSAFHPLCCFPGPKLAAVTELYQVYFDIVKRGGLLNHLRELHGEYGPVVRIGPNTVHFASERAYHDIYTHGQFPKYKPFYDGFAQPGSSFGYIDPQKARTRRALLNPLFSRRAILKLEGVVQERVNKLVERLSTWPKAQSINMSFAFRCTTLDIITAYCFANCFNAVAAPEFRDPTICAIQGSLHNYWLRKHFPILLRIVDIMPQWLTLWVYPQVRPFLDNQRNLGNQIDRILTDPDVLKVVEHETIYHHMLDPVNEDGVGMDPKEHVQLTRKDLLDEAMTLIGAGSDTVGSTCSMGTFHALYNPAIARKLKEELESVWEDPGSPVDLAVLEKLPYLTAFLKESLRFGHGVVSPLPRVVGDTGAVIDGMAIPPGTVISMSCVFLHESPDIFDDPLTFSPERWLQSDIRHMEHNLVPFSKGQRIWYLLIPYQMFSLILIGTCSLGLNLAWCELYLIIANIFRKLDMKLGDTTLEDMRNYKEYLVPHWENSSVNIIVNAARG
ncbi:hypothetical protein VNI00_012995 [Paramarasmius palmivorus]|uniref:Cytochrome P450 n=1 Tax=Paramarasmius palmivorus TaxID=297713 RepID=A0AAW0C1C3_9AGAR